MNANIKFKELIKNLGIKESSALSSGRLEEIKIIREQGLWVFNFAFDSCLPIDCFIELDSKVKQMMSNLKGVNDVEVLYEYHNYNISKELLQQYWEYFLNLLGNESPRLLVLHELTVKYDDNKVTYYVANNDEAEIVKPFINSINENLSSVGFEVEAGYVISEFETPFSNLIKENIRLTNEKVRREAELLKNNVPESDNTNNSPIFKRRPRGPRAMDKTPVKLNQIPATETEVIEYEQKYNNLDFVIEGEILDYEIREVRGGYKIYSATVTDGTDSLLIKTFLNTRNMEAEEKFYHQEASTKKRVRVFGNVSYDQYARDVVLNVKDLHGLGDMIDSKRTDEALEKRIELHAHSKMSAEDGIMELQEYVDTAVRFGHKALAITDHFNIHAHPEFCNLTKKLDIKPIYGLEGAVVDEASYKIALSDEDILLDDAIYVVYDLETTGLSARFNEIIEIAAVKIQYGNIIDEFSTYVKPNRLISPKITEITSITNDDVRNAPKLEEVLPKFFEFINGGILVAHNATFDNSFIYVNLRRLNIYHGTIPTIDTLELARVVYGDKLRRFNLKAVTKFFDVDLEQHHRAIYDAKATSLVFLKMLNDLRERNIRNYNELNDLINLDEIYRLTFPKHINILSKNKNGQKNLNKIISRSHTVNMAREPIILKSFLNKNREDLLIGSSCSNGEVWDAAFNHSYERLLEVVDYYDYLEVLPPSAYEHLVEDSGEEITRRFIKEAIKDIIRAGKERNIPVVATGDVHHLEKEDVIYRDIFVKSPLLGNGRHNLAHIEKIPSLYFMTTNEMLQEFKFLDDDLAYEIVVRNTNLIADMIEKYEIFPKKLFTPRDDFLSDRGVPSLRQGVIDLTFTNARKRYGNLLPEYVKARIEKELNSIINNDFASIYYISYLLVAKSKSDGYVVGSRGSVGSSVVATFMEITEVNPLAPHYVCPKCHFTAFKLNPDEKKLFKQDERASKFEEQLQKVDTGLDLPDNLCPKCSTALDKDGVDIPFETFLGFEGDKVPDIDLNFSGEYQNKAHEFCRELFGEDNAFRAGTISTIATKTAYGYVKGYYERQHMEVRYAEINRIAKQIEGVKRSTGQHPGGIIVIPDEIKYYDIIPIQYPADDTSSAWRTSHYDYHSFESNLLKLDILGHDDPTMIRHLMDFVEDNPDDFPFNKVEDIPLTDKDVLRLFTGVEVLGVTPSQVFGETVGTSGIPEFGTNFTKDMLRDIKPQTFSDLLKVSGLSHGTDVWGGNARDLLLGLKEGVGAIPFKDLIGCRDDIMVYLMNMNLPSKSAFQIMESVRKGRGLTPEQEKEMVRHNVPKWYIDSCKLIKYMFPKAHATAYVIMALRIAWFKVHRPIYYYAAYFSRRTDAFDIIAMAQGSSKIEERLEELAPKVRARKASVKENEIYNTLILALEMVSRGYRFEQIDIFRSHWRNFTIEKDKRSLLIPFGAMDSLGISTAKSVVEAREESLFTSKRDVLNRTKINTTVFERLNEIDAFKNLPDDDQIGLF